MNWAVRRIEVFERAEFEALAWTMRLGSTESAAVQLGCSADGIRILIRKLEYRLAMKLFEQGEIAETLTTTGAAVALHASVILEQLDKITVCQNALK